MNIISSSKTLESGIDVTGHDPAPYPRRRHVRNGQTRAFISHEPYMLAAFPFIMYALGPSMLGIEYLGNRISLVPIRKVPDGSKLIGVPETFTPGSPANSVVQSTANAEGFAVKVCQPTTKTEELGNGVESLSITVLLPITKLPEGPRLVGVPDNVIRVPPGDIVVPSIGNPEGSALNVCPATVKVV